ncbi:fibroin heavy chain fib-H-like [Streptomyces sp. NL15-2K]|nr:fibroin heavy chain fib-H-like [Streptomyces sp. NL15-2K]
MRPGDAVAWHEPAHSDTAALEALLAAAMRRGEVGGEGERRAVAAFRDARDAGRHGARTRRRDDWRPREQRMPRSLKATLSVFLASLTLGGVAFAAIGSGSSSTHGSEDGPGRPGSSTGASDRPSAAPSASNSPSSSAPADRPTTAQDTEAHCRAYEQVKDRGKALDASAWRQLVTAAGSEANVNAYCAEQLKRATADSKPSPGRNGTPGISGGGTGSVENGSANAGSAGSAGDAGNDGTGDADGAGGDSTGNGGTGSGADNGQGQTGKAQGTKP